MGAGFSGGFVADGAGAGDVSGTTLRVGSGNGDALRFALPLVLAFPFAFEFGLGAGLRSSSGSTEGSKLAAGLAFAFTLAGGVILPPDGMPSSLFPVGD